MGNPEEKIGKFEDEVGFAEKLEELRQTFSRLENLNNTLESKAATLFGFAAVLISVMIFTLSSILSTPLNLSTFTIYAEYTFFGLIVVLLIVILRGLTYLLEVIKLRKYTYPFYFDPNLILKTIKLSPENFKNEIIKDYRLAIPNHTCINEKKVALLNKGVKWLTGGFLASFILMMIFILIKMVCGSYG